MSSEKLALAAHLHVVLRRHMGRVTDVEWLVRDLSYAREIIALARSSGQEDCLHWADKFEAAVSAHHGARPMPEASASPSPPAQTPQPAPGRRYVGSLR